MSDSINSIRHLLLTQEPHIKGKSLDQSQNSSLDSRYDTDSSPQRPLEACSSLYLYNINRKVCQKDELELKTNTEISIQDKSKICILFYLLVLTILAIFFKISSNIYIRKFKR